MKNLSRMSLLVLLLTGASFAQQEVSPDRFEGEAAKQPLKMKHVAKPGSARLVQAKHRANNKPVNKAALSARVVGGN